MFSLQTLTLTFNLKKRAEQPLARLNAFNTRRRLFAVTADRAASAFAAATSSVSATVTATATATATVGVAVG